MKIPKFICCAAGAAWLLAIAGTCYADYASEVLAQGPLTYWRFSETYAYQPVATNHGSIGAAGHGAYSEVLAHPPGPMVASADPAAAFNGSDQKIDVPFNAAFNPPGAFTVEFWAIITNYVATIAPLQSRGPGAADGYLFFANNGGDNKWWFRTYTGTTRANVISTNNILPNQWTHVVGVRDESGANHLYINGVEAAPPTVGGYTPQTSMPLRIGAGANEAVSPSWYWPGHIDEVAIYPTALSAAQVAAHYQNAMDPAPAQSYSALVASHNPVGYWRLNESGEPRQVALNLGSLGAAGDGVYLNGTLPEAGTLIPPAFPALEATNRQVRFNGTVDQVAVRRPNLPVPWTASFWVNRQDALAASAVLLTSPSTGLKLEQWEGAQNLTRRVGFTAYGVADYFFEYSAPADTWVNLTFVGTPSGTLLYTNGFLADSNPASITLPMTRIGGFGDPPRMQLDEVATFNRALLEGQIRSLYLTAVGDVNPPGFVNNIPIVSPAGTIYTTTPFTLSIDAYGAGPLTYEWRRNGTVVGTSRDYAVASATLADGGSYDVVIRNAHGSATSGTVTVVIDPAVPPTITQPPVAKSVFAGGDASFTVTASGTTPFTYQWKKGSVNMTGATNQTLVLTNVGTADAATYSVGVSNVAGGVVSAGAALTIPTLTAGSFLEAVVTNGPINFWRLGEAPGATTAFDSMGRLDGTYQSGVTLGLPGGVPFGGANTAVQFDGTANGQITLNGARIQPPWSAVFWVKRPDLVVASSALINESGQTSLRLEQWQSTGHVGFTRYGVADYEFAYTAPAETWVQLVFVGKTASTELYVDGEFIASNPNSIALPRQSIGNSGDPLIGQLDEVALYGKALSPEAIAQMYAAGAYGSATVPFITRQPASQTAIAGSPVTFSVVAKGSIPLSYQWSKGATPIPGATTSTLTFAKAAYGDEASYTVRVANGAGNITSAAATLTVLPAPTFANLTNGLVVHLKFDGDYNDSSGRANDGFAMGAPTIVPGKLGSGALRYSTTATEANYLILPPSSDLMFGTDVNFSVGFWIKFTGLPGDLPFLCNNDYSYGGPGITLAPSYNEGGWSWYLADLGAGNWQGTGLYGPPNTINDGNWHHLLYTFDRAGFGTVYRDGVMENQTSITNGNWWDLDTGRQLHIGQAAGVYTEVGTFDMDDFGLWRRVLTPYEALSIYNAAQGAGQSFDVYGPVRLDIGAAGSDAMIGYQAGILESNDDLTNPNGWAPVSGAAPPKHTVVSGTGRKFYRVRLN